MLAQPAHAMEERRAGEHAFEQARPAHARGGRGRMIGSGLRVLICARRYDPGAQLGMEGEHTVEADQVQAWRRYQRC